MLLPTKLSPVSTSNFLSYPVPAPVLPPTADALKSSSQSSSNSGYMQLSSSFLLRSRLADNAPTMTAMVPTENSTMGMPPPARALAALAPNRSLDCSAVHRSFHPESRRSRGGSAGAHWSRGRGRSGGGLQRTRVVVVNHGGDGADGTGGQRGAAHGGRAARLNKCS